MLYHYKSIHHSLSTDRSNAIYACVFVCMRLRVQTNLKRRVGFKSLDQHNKYSPSFREPGSLKYTSKHCCSGSNHSPATITLILTNQTLSTPSGAKCKKPLISACFSSMSVSERKLISSFTRTKTYYMAFVTQNL